MYSFIFAEVLKLTGDIIQLVPTMIGLSALLCFVFSFYAVANLLYGFKDYDFLASLPVKRLSIVLSKLSAMFLVNVAFALLITIPALIFYGLNATLTAGFVLKSLLYAILSPLLPLSISIVIGALFTFISARAKFKNLITTILYFLIIAVAFVFSFSSMEDGNMGIVQKMYFVMPLLVKGYADIWQLLLYIGVSILPFAIIILVVSATFDKMNTLIKARPKNKNFKLKGNGGKGEFHALFVKEFKRLGTCPMYLMNSLMGAIMPIVGVIALAIVFKSVPPMVTAMIAPFIVPFAPVLFVFCFGIAPTTNCALSLEGNNFWLMRTMPVDSKKLLNAKLSVNAVLYVASALISTLIVAIFFKLSFALSLLFVGFAVVLALFFGVFGLWVNLKKPMMDWDNIQKPVKQSASVSICVFSGMGLSAIFAVIGYFMLFGQGTALEFLTKTSAELYFGILVALFVALTIYLYSYIIRNGEKMLSKIGE
jgi:ABC-2 type transport system permease protein